MPPPLDYSFFQTNGYSSAFLPRQPSENEDDHPPFAPIWDSTWSVSSYQAPTDWMTLQDYPPLLLQYDPAVPASLPAFNVPAPVHTHMDFGPIQTVGDTFLGLQLDDSADKFESEFVAYPESDLAGRIARLSPQLRAYYQQILGKHSERSDLKGDEKTLYLLLDVVESPGFPFEHLSEELVAPLVKVWPSGILECRVCSKQPKNKSMCIEHVHRCLGVKWQPCNEINRKGEKCPQRFVATSDLSRHKHDQHGIPKIKMHGGPRPIHQRPPAKTNKRARHLTPVMSVSSSARLRRMKKGPTLRVNAQPPMATKPTTDTWKVGSVVREKTGIWSTFPQKRDIIEPIRDVLTLSFSKLVKLAVPWLRTIQLAISNQTILTSSSSCHSPKTIGPLTVTFISQQTRNLRLSRNTLYHLVVLFSSWIVFVSCSLPVGFFPSTLLLPSCTVPDLRTHGKNVFLQISNLNLRLEKVCR